MMVPDLVFVDPQYGTCFMAAFWYLELGGGFWDFGKFVHLCLMYLLAVHKDCTISLHRPEQGNRVAKAGSFKNCYYHKPKDFFALPP
jgi:hypothetical protein